MESCSCYSILKSDPLYEAVNGRDTMNGRTPLLEACLMNRDNVVVTLINSRLKAGMFSHAAMKLQTRAYFLSHSQTLHNMFYINNSGSLAPFI